MLLGELAKGLEDIDTYIIFLLLIDQKNNFPTSVLGSSYAFSATSIVPIIQF